MSTDSAPGLMFPGQGTQRPGMGRALERNSPAASAVFDLASDVLGRDLRSLCFSGPARQLTDTRNAQVAIFTCNAAAAELVRELGYRPQLAMGHSVGELNALCEAGVLPLAEGLRLVSARAELMGRITAPGAMSAIIGLEPETVVALCAEASDARLGEAGTPVVPALINGPRNVVVSGAVAGVERAEEFALAAGARKVTRLVVSSAFHSPLMAEAAGEWRDVVGAFPLSEPAIPVVLNTTGTVARDADDIRHALVDQLTGPVRWVEDVQAAALAGVRTLVEAGDSKVLSALVRSIDPSQACLSLHDPHAVRRLRAGAPALAPVAAAPAGAATFESMGREAS
jgi:[acyl-carrier-protein] S-malonyltransferase